MKDNYSWLDNSLEEFRLEVIDCFYDGAGHLQEVINEAKQTIISQIEIEKLRAEIHTLMGFRRRDFVSGDLYEYAVMNRIPDLQEKLKELEPKGKDSNN